jgi:exodeoxyribonuclease V beta subunit
LEGVFFWKEKSLVRKALAGPYIGLTAQEIASFSSEEEQRFLEKFRYLHDLWQEEGLAAVFREFWQQVWREKSVLEKLAFEEDIVLYRDTEQLIELILESMSKKPKTKENVLHFFSEAKEMSPDDQEGFFQRYLLGEDGVEIITIHKSKGLEYEVVFAFGVRGKSPDAEEDEEIEFEKLRQFYVALTRAKSRVYIPMILEDRKIQEDGSSLYQFFTRLQASYQKEEAKGLLEEFAKEEFFSCGFLEHVLKVENGGFVEKDKVIFPNQKSPYRRDKGSIFSFSALAHEDSGPEENKDEIFLEDLFKKMNKETEKDQEKEKVKTETIELPKGKELGIIGHAILEEAFRSSLYRLDNEKIESALEKKIQQQVEGTKFSSFSWGLFEKVKMVLSTPLLSGSGTIFGSEGFCLKSIQKDHFFVETEFLYSWKEEDFLKGFIDLLFFYEGKYFLVDWKWNFFDGLYTQEAMEKIMKENHYFLQAAIYTEAFYRLLKKYKIEDVSQKFGGMFYLFIRGMKAKENFGIYHFFPDRKLVNSTDTLEKTLCQDFL